MNLPENTKKRAIKHLDEVTKKYGIEIDREYNNDILLIEHLLETSKTLFKVNNLK